MSWYFPLIPGRLGYGIAPFHALSGPRPVLPRGGHLRGGVATSLWGGASGAGTFPGRCLCPGNSWEGGWTSEEMAGVCPGLESLSELVLTDPCGLCGRNATTEVFIFLWNIKETCTFFHGLWNHWVGTSAFLRVPFPCAITCYLFPYRQLVVVKLFRVQLCDPVSCNLAGFPVLHYLLEFAQIRVHCVRDAIQPSHPLLPSSPFAFSLSQHQGPFQWVSSLHQWPKSWSFSINPSNEYSDNWLTLKIRIPQSACTVQESYFVCMCTCELV